MWVKLERDCICPGKGSEKTYEDLKFTPQGDLGTETAYNNKN